MNKTVITSAPEGMIDYVKKIWSYKALIIVFAKRDLKVKYAQTWLGLSWTIIQPLTGLLVFAFFFGYILHWKAEGISYPLYVLSGLLGWNFFNYIVFQGTNSIQESSSVIKKIYFPKAILPLSKIVIALVEVSVSFLLLIPLLVWQNQALSWRIIFIPFISLFTILISLSFVFIFSALAYRKRDFLHLVPFIVYFGIWLTPVFFTKSSLPQKVASLWYINPMAAVVEGWRWCLFPQWQYNLNYLYVLVGILPLFVLSVYLYKEVESKFSDFA